LIDISDGLVGDAGHLAAASGAGLVIDVDRVPLHPSVEVSDMALVSGEEYELLVALPSDFDFSAASEFSECFGLPLTRIGQVERESGVRLVREGKRVWTPKGFEHF
jgi:thiamine-monophosphate kinase